MRWLPADISSPADDMVGNLRSGALGRSGTPKPERKRRGTQDKSSVDYENVRKKVMEENLSRTTEALKEQAVESGRPLQDFTALVRSVVYGAAQPGIKPSRKDAQQQKKGNMEDPIYEPDHAEEHTDDDEFTLDEVEHNVDISSSMVLEPSSKVQQKKRTKTVLPPSTTRSKPNPETENAGTVIITNTAGEGATDGTETSPTQIQTSRDNNSPEDNAVVHNELEATKRGGHRPTLGHGLHAWSRRNGGAKMQIVFTAGMRRPKQFEQASKLSSECGIHIRNKMPLATHGKQYRDEHGPLKHVIPQAIKTVAGKFEMDRSNEVAKGVDILRNGIRQHRYRLKRRYWEKVKYLTLSKPYC
ncbi:uncharacterized protein LOC112271044 [Brachypodium distachyon]|uniref:Uncharacterized protein n=1 Tax=Brachypodium distachyon TaxID=15368 RepID=A0A2K2DA39_BRADI|nr:uncharacterized protein LOC112271044 [Brachypodium distachyon]PNT71144.1 hypothetical protein BRADI_2g23665v3 [Brachypodium distachyon]|eukprot:XP_024315716.1 uncharacterized protein LOC112271044 [Brachypodium distachyon]